MADNISTPAPITSTKGVKFNAPEPRVDDNKYSLASKPPVAGAAGKYDNTLVSDPAVMAAVAAATDAASDTGTQGFARRLAQEEAERKAKEKDGKKEEPFFVTLIKAIMSFLNPEEKANVEADVAAKGAGGATVTPNQVRESAQNVTGIDISKLDPKILYAAKSEQAVMRDNGVREGGAVVADADVQVQAGGGMSPRAEPAGLGAA